MKFRHQLGASIVALATCTTWGQVINIPQAALLPLGDPGQTAWLAQDAGLIGPTDMRMLTEVTGTAVANSMLLDVQNDGFPGTGGTTNDLVIFQPSDVPGAMASVDIPPNCALALFHDVYDENGEFLAGPDGILNVNPVPGTSDAYLSSNTENNYTVEGRRQMVKYLPVSPAHSYQFTSQWGTVSQLGSGYRLFLFFDDDHSPNYDYDDIIVGVIAPPCTSDADCTDNDVCNGIESCVEGVCLPGTPMTCDDGDFCNGAEVCVEGICGPGTPPTCDDAVPCTIDSCADNACVHVPSDVLCPGDELFCNGVESCDPLLGCVSSGNPCEPGQVCDEELNHCRTCEVDADCDDANPCTMGEACVEGACVPGTPVDCSASSSTCFIASCDPSGEPGNCDQGLIVADGTPCDDGLFCTVDDSCDGAFCTGVGRDCGDAEGPCMVRGCDETLNACTSRPADDGTECNDNHACTFNDVCLEGVCQGSGTFSLVGWALFSSCMEGPGAEYSDPCGCSDFNLDSAIDLKDAAEFQLRFLIP